MLKKHKIIVCIILIIISIPIVKITYNRIHKEGVTPLMFAAKGGDLEMVKELIENGEDVNEKSDYNWTALMFATYEGKEDIVKTLLENGASPNIISKEIPGRFDFGTTGGVYPTSALKISI